MGCHRGLTCPILRGPFHTKHCARAGGSSRRRKEANRSPVSPCLCPMPPASVPRACLSHCGCPRQPGAPGGHVLLFLILPMGLGPSPRAGRCFLAGLFLDLRHSLEGPGSRKRRRDKGMGRERRGERRGGPVAIGIGSGCQGLTPAGGVGLEREPSRILSQAKTLFPGFLRFQK